MKRISMHGHLLMFILCFCFFEGFSQKTNKGTVIGKVTIDEKGQVTLLPYNDPVRCADPVQNQTGQIQVTTGQRMDIHSSTATQETSTGEPLVSPVSTEIKGYPDPLNIQPHCSGEEAVRNAGAPEMEDLLKITGMQVTSSGEVKAMTGSARIGYDKNTESLLSAAPVELLSLSGSLAVPNLTYKSGSSSCTVTGTTINLTFSVINNGTVSAGASTVGYFLSADVSISSEPNYKIGSNPVGTLAAGAFSEETITVNVADKSVPCGSYYIFFCIDYLKEVAESSETDNDWYITSPKVDVPCTPNLDLLSGSSSLNVTGTSISLTVTAINNGSTTAGASTLGYFLSPDANYTTTPNYLIGTDAVPSLAVGATSTQTLSVDVSMSSVPCGTYYVFFVFDHTNQVTESNENDNIWYFSSPTVTIPCVPNLDLSSGTATLNVTGTTATIGLTVINNGSTAAPASELGYYLSPDVSITTTPNYLIGTDAVPALAVGGTSAQSLTKDVLTVTPLIPCGTYYVIFFMDHLKQVTEVNESDNIWYFTSPQVTVPSKPNLTYQSGSGTFTVTGTTVNLKVTAINNGNCTSEACNVGYYLSPDISITTNPNYLIGTGPIPSLSQGATSQLTFVKDVLTVTPLVPKGSYYLFFCFDNLDQVAESNENDNDWYFTSPQVNVSTTCTLGASPAGRSVTSAAGSTSFSVTAGCLWTAVSNQAWCTLTPSSGTGNGSFTANYTVNTTCNPRTATITLNIAGGDPVTVTVTQAACSLSMSPTAKSVSAAGGTTSFSLTTNCNWTASSNQPWCVVSPSSGTGNATISVDYTTNTSCGERVATISCTTSGCSPVPITLTQSGCTLISVSDLILDCTAGSEVLMLTTGCSWSISSSQSWCTISPASGTGNKNVVVTCTANNTASSRYATLSITVPGCTPRLVNVTQPPCGVCTLNVNPLNQNVPKAGGSRSFAVNSVGSCTWTATSDQAWCSVSPASGTGDKIITATCTASAVPLRTANISVTIPGSPGLTRTVTVTQSEGCCPPPEHFNVAWSITANDTMNVFVLKATLDGINLETEDEIALFDGSICVGAAKLSEVIDNSHPLYIKSSKDKGTANGYTEGNPINYKFWDKSGSKEITGVTAFYYSDLPGWSTSGNFKSAAVSYVTLTGLSTGISSVRLPGMDLRIYPNPTEGKIYISAGNVSLKDSKITAIDAHGQIIFEQIIGEDQGTIDFSGNTRGLYFLRISAPSWSVTEKIILR